MSERHMPRSRKSKRGAAQWWIRLIVLIFLFLAVLGGIGAAFYISKGKKYQEVFFPNTVINGVDASEQTIEEVKKKIAEGIQGYQLVIEERGGAQETVTMEEIGLHSVFDGSLEAMLEAQNPNEWLRYTRESQSFEVPTMIAYDETAFQERIDGLECLDAENVTQPQDAYLSEYTPGVGYSIVPEEQGNELDKDKVIEVISHAILNLQQSVNLEEEGCYKEPSILQDNEALQNTLQVYNRYANINITLDMGEGALETLDSDTIHSWVTIADDLSVSVDEGAIETYVKSIAKKYNTAYTKRNFKTTTGQTVTISKGDYGWRMNQPTEKKALTQMVRDAESGTRTVEYYQRAVVHSDKDWGSTYVEINLTAQHLYFYKNGKLIVETDFVSGNSAKGYDTPAGIYGITYTEKDAVLKGEDYRTPVSFWMPFNGGIGLHDATWRNKFGGTIYKTNGSHGCVNLPYNAAKTIFENIKKNDPVICYHLEGSESTKTSTGTKPAETTAATTTVAETKAPETKAPETTAAETKAPETKAPETKAPETKAPETTAAETKAPETKAPETTAAITQIPGNSGTETNKTPGETKTPVVQPGNPASEPTKEPASSPGQNLSETKNQGSGPASQGGTNSPSPGGPGSQ